MDRSRQTPTEWFRITLTNFPKPERNPSWVQWPQFPIAKDRCKENKGGGREPPLPVSDNRELNGTYWWETMASSWRLVSGDTAGLGLRNGFSRETWGCKVMTQPGTESSTR